MMSLYMIKTVGEVLEERGFLLDEQGDQLNLSPGNGQKDMQDLQQLFRKEGIPVIIQNWRLQILTPPLPHALLRQWRLHPRKPGHFYIPNGFRTWKGFTRRSFGLRWNTLELDRGIALLVKAMSEAGILVTGGCDGHRHRPPKIYLAGEWSALWWESILRSHINGKELLHYQWRVDYPDQGSPAFTAIKEEHEQWNIKHIQEDTVMIAKQIRKRAQHLRMERKQAFKYKSMKAITKHLQGNLPSMRHWLEAQLQIMGGSK